MTALSANKNVLEKKSAFSQLVGDAGSATPDAAGVFYQGAMLAYDTADDTIKPAETSTTLVALGRCEEAGAAGELSSVRVRSGIFKFENSAAADLIENHDTGADCYIVDDQTVAIVATGRSVAGKVVSVVSDGVWVAVNPLA